MTLYNLYALEPSPCAAQTLAILAKAIRSRTVAPARRVSATADSRCPEEGLALLNAYVSIADREVRQAILDAVLAMSEADPYF